jgi:hypothetical protein
MTFSAGVVPATGRRTTSQSAALISPVAFRHRSPAGRASTHYPAILVE